MDLGRRHGLVAEAHLARACCQGAYHNQGMDPTLLHAARELAAIGFGGLDGAGPGNGPGGERSGFLNGVTDDESRLLRLLHRFDLTLQLGKGLDGRIDVALITWDPEGDPKSGNVFAGVDFS